MRFYTIEYRYGYSASGKKREWHSSYEAALRARTLRRREATERPFEFRNELPSGGPHQVDVPTDKKALCRFLNRWGGIP